LWKNIKHLFDLIKSALGEMRILLLELRPESLENTDLESLLSHLVDASEVQTDAQIVLQQDIRQRLPVDVKIAFYRIVQEALHNAIKHAYSEHIFIKVICKDDTFRLTVEDDGVGFPQNKELGDRFGLTIMSERAAEVGATFMLQNKPSGGAQVLCTWEPEGDECV
jgi:signal transduction histidine kinase